MARLESLTESSNQSTIIDGATHRNGLKTSKENLLNVVANLNKTNSLNIEVTNNQEPENKISLATAATTTTAPKNVVSVMNSSTSPSKLTNTTTTTTNSTATPTKKKRTPKKKKLIAGANDNEQEVNVLVRNDKVNPKCCTVM